MQTGFSISRVAPQYADRERWAAPAIQRQKDGRLFNALAANKLTAANARSGQFALGIDGTGRTGLTGPNTPTNAGDASPLMEGIREEFVGALMLELEQTRAFWERVLFRRVAANTSYYQYTVAGTAPYPVHQPRGTAPASGPVDFLGGRIDVFAWALRLYAHRDDLADDQTGGFQRLAARARQNYVTLVHRIAAQMLLGATDNELLPILATSADGVGMFSATDGDGANRFGVSGGNLENMGATPDASVIRDWLFDVQVRWRRMLDRKGQPLINPAAINEEMVVIHGPAMRQRMREALDQKLVFAPAVEASAVVGAAAPTNIIIDSGMRVTPFETPFFTGDQCVAILTSDSVERPAAWVERENLYEVYADEPVSDYSRNTQQVYWQFRERFGAGSVLPYAAIYSSST